MASYVRCEDAQGDPDDTVVFGPFEDDAWARAWIKQHDHHPESGVLTSMTDEQYENRITDLCDDFNHFCENRMGDTPYGKAQHTIFYDISAPGFDPETTPIYV